MGDEGYVPWRPKPGLETWLCRHGIHVLCHWARRKARKA